MLFLALGENTDVGPVGLEPTTHGLKVLSLREAEQSLTQKLAGHTLPWLLLSSTNYRVMWHGCGTK